MACNCSKPLVQSDCDRLKEHANDSGTYIFHIFEDDKGLQIARVPQGANPNTIATQNGFKRPDGQLEWFNVKEHPCAYENN